MGKLKQDGTILILITFLLVIFSFFVTSIQQFQSNMITQTSNLKIENNVLNQIIQIGIDIAKYEWSENPTVRTDHINGEVLSNYNVLGGTLTMSFNDPTDGDLTNSNLDPVNITITANYRDSTKSVLMSFIFELDKKMLLIYDDAGSFPAHLTGQITTFEDMGWEVFLLDDTASLTDITDSISDNAINLIYLDDGISSTVITNVTGLTTAIASEDNSHWQDLGMTNVSTTTKITNGSSITADGGCLFCSSLTSPVSYSPSISSYNQVLSTEVDSDAQIEFTGNGDQLMLAAIPSAGISSARVGFINPFTSTDPISDLTTDGLAVIEHYLDEIGCYNNNCPIRVELESLKVLTPAEL